jgi:DNA transformation protein and related proteins
MTPPDRLRNLGAKSSQWLAAVGIHTQEDLMAIGAVDAYLRVRAAFPDRVSLNLLWALEGALLGLPWTEIPPELKDDLRRQVEEERGD